MDPLYYRGLFLTWQDRRGEVWLGDARGRTARRLPPGTQPHLWHPHTWAHSPRWQLCLWGWYCRRVSFSLFKHSISLPTHLKYSSIYICKFCVLVWTGIVSAPWNWGRCWGCNTRKEGSWVASGAMSVASSHHPWPGPHISCHWSWVSHLHCNTELMQSFLCPLKFPSQNWSAKLAIIKSGDHIVSCNFVNFSVYQSLL